MMAYQKFGKVPSGSAGKHALPLRELRRIKPHGELEVVQKWSSQKRTCDPLNDSDMMHTQATKFSSRSGGFTLIEMLVVVGILGLVSGLVIVSYDKVLERGSLDYTRRQMGMVRDALLQFRRDMGYLPGEGPLVPSNLDLSQITFIDGDTPTRPVPSPVVGNAWAEHPCNFWMLLTQPRDRLDVNRWMWNRDAGRGWRGPYLDSGFHFRLNGAGDLGSGFVGGMSLNRLVAFHDGWTRKNVRDQRPMWVEQTPEPWQPGVPITRPAPVLGMPLALVREVNELSVPPEVTFTLVSAGPNQVFELDAENYGDDVRVEVARVKQP